MLSGDKHRPGSQRIILFKHCVGEGDGELANLGVVQAITKIDEPMDMSGFN